MALDLPPPVTPQQAEIAEIRQSQQASQGGVFELTVDRFRMLVSGNTYLDEGRIREVTAAAQTPSQVILLMNALYAAEGHLFVSIQYAREGDLILVRVNEGYLKDVDAPSAIEPYFEKFENQQNVKASDMEPRRILAELKSQRAGFDIRGKYVIDPDDPEAFTMVLDGYPQENHDGADYTLTFGNPGNRFLGRYFGLANANFNLPNGDTIGLGFTHGFTNLGSSRGGEKYERGDLSYSTVTPWGLYGFSGGYTEYEVENLLNNPAVSNDLEEAEIIEARLNGNQFLYARDANRWVLEQQIEYVDSTIDVTRGSLLVPADVDLGLVGGLLGDLLGGLLGTGITTQDQVVDLSGTRLQDEQFVTGRLGTTYSRTWKFQGREGSVSIGGGYKHAFDADIESQVDTRRGDKFSLFDASLSVNHQLPGKLLGTFSVRAQQSTDDRLPQQLQWVLGGPDNISAYLPGVLVGDTGLFGQLRVQLPRWELFGIPYRFSTFVEYGSAEFENTSGQGDFGERRSITDGGLKLEIAPYKTVEIILHAAREISSSNLDDEFLEDNESDVFFTVKATF